MWLYVSDSRGIITGQFVAAGKQRRLVAALAANRLYN